MKKNILFIADSAAGIPPAVSTAPAVKPFTQADALQQAADLRSAVEKAESLAAGLLKQPALANCPYLAAIRSGISNGALERLKHLDTWLKENPVPATSAK